MDVEPDVSLRLFGNVTWTFEEEGRGGTWLRVKVYVVAGSELRAEELEMSMLVKAAGVLTLKDMLVTSYSIWYPSL